MPITPYWYDEEKTILIHRYEGSWAWGDVYHAQAEAIEMAKGLQHNIYVIADGTDADLSMPSDWITHLYRIAKRNPPNWVLAVIVNDAMLIQVMKHVTRIFERVFPHHVEKYKYVSLFADAFPIIEAHKAQCANKR